MKIKIVLCKTRPAGRENLWVDDEFGETDLPTLWLVFDH